jgi:hypothetical protein
MSSSAVLSDFLALHEAVAFAREGAALLLVEKGHPVAKFFTLLRHEGQDSLFWTSLPASEADQNKDDLPLFHLPLSLVTSCEPCEPSQGNRAFAVGFEVQGRAGRMVMVAGTREEASKWVRAITSLSQAANNNDDDDDDDDDDDGLDVDQDQDQDSNMGRATGATLDAEGEELFRRQEALIFAQNKAIVESSRLEEVMARRIAELEETVNVKNQTIQELSSLLAAALG